VPTDEETRNPIKQWSNNVIEDMKKIFGESESIGKNVGDGFIKGLESSNVEAESNGVWEKVKEGWKNFWGIKSPSKVTQEMGEFIGEGFEIGIEESTQSIPEIFGEMITNIGKHLTAELPENIKKPIVKAVEDAVVIARSSFDRIKDFGINLWDGVKDFGIGTWNFIKGTGLEIGFFFKDLFTNPLDLLDRQLGKFLDNLKFTASVIAGVFSGIGSAIVGSSGVLSGAADAWKASQTDPETGEKKATVDLAGGITGVLTSLITSSSQFGELMEAINPILQKVADFFGRLLTPLIPIVTMIADALLPLLNLLEPFLLQITWLLEKVVTPIISFLSNLIITIYNTIAGVFNWVLGIIDSLPFVSVKYRLPTAENVNPATATTEEVTASGGGTQISEITGATRDLLTSLLSPLSSLDSLTGIGNRIYDLLEDRLVGGVTIGTINVTPANGESVSEATAREIEEAISERLAFMGAV